MPGLHHICMRADDVDARVAERDAEVVQRGVMPGGMEFAYVSAEPPGCPTSRSPTSRPMIQAFFDYIKQEHSEYQR